MKQRITFLLLLFYLFPTGGAAQSNRLSGEAREELIQKALLFRKEENFNGAIQQLDSVLSDNPADAPVLLFRGDLLLQARRFAEAAATYKQILPLKYESAIAMINLSYALFMGHQPAKALQYARRAWEENKKNSNAVVNYFNAMLWNSKTKEASRFLKQQDSLLSPAQQLVLKARLNTTAGNYTEGLKYYDSLVKAYPEKYYVQEYAEVLLGKKEMAQSLAIMQSSKELFTDNEYKAYARKIDATRRQNAGTEMVYFKDVAKNIRIENSIWWQQNESRKYRLRLSAGVSAITSAQKEKISAQFAHINVKERWSKAWTGETDVHLQLIQPAEGKHFTGITGKQTVQFQPNDRRMFGVFYSADILNYTASLLEKNIRSNNAGYITHIMLSGKTGIYSQGSAGFLTDKNQRFQFFGSLYHLLRTEPTLKAGFNFSALHYKDSTVKSYFSPNRYLNTEVFADYSTPLPMLSKFYVQMQAAAGMQKIDDKEWEPALRLQTELGLRLQQLETAVKYQTSNVASGTGTGYKFNWFTVRVTWRW